MKIPAKIPGHVPKNKLTWLSGGRCCYDRNGPIFLPHELWTERAQKSIAEQMTDGKTYLRHRSRGLSLKTSSQNCSDVITVKLTWFAFRARVVMATQCSMQGFFPNFRSSHLVREWCKVVLGADSSQKTDVPDAETRSMHFLEKRTCLEIIFGCSGPSLHPRKEM